METKEFKGKSIIVTGAGNGIGKAISLAFAREGGDVVLTGRNRENMDQVAEELKNLETNPLVVPADVSDVGQVEFMVKKALETFGKIDVLVNNSGIGGPTALAHEITPEEWDLTLAVNLNGAFYCSKYVSAAMVKAGRGNIVNISSVAGRIGYALRTPYAASKWGMIGLSHSMAAELGPHGIRVNVVLPGPVEGDRIKGVIQARAQAKGETYEEAMKFFLGPVPLERMVTEEEVAQTTVYLASEKSSGVTGQALNVDGGFRMQ